MFSNKKSTKLARNILVNETCPNIDYKYGPYESLEEAFQTLRNLEVLCIGLTVGITTENGIKEYWFEKGCSNIGDLVEKGVNLDARYMDWLEKQVSEAIQNEAQDLFSLTTTTSGNLVYYSDTTLQSYMQSIVKVVLNFNGRSGVKAKNIPNGWTETQINDRFEYSIQLDPINKVAPITDFEYEIQEGTYQGLIVSGKSQYKSLQIINPAWYGFNSSGKISDKNKVIPYLNRITGPIDKTQNLENQNQSSDQYFWIITKGSGQASQFGVSIMNDPVISDIQSPENQFINLESYKIYISQNSINPGGILDNVSIQIVL